MSDIDGLNPDQLQLYRESLFRALNNFYITIGQQKNQQELETSVLKREGNINKLYNALEKKYDGYQHLPAAFHVQALEVEFIDNIANGGVTPVIERDVRQYPAGYDYPGPIDLYGQMNE